MLTSLKALRLEKVSGKALSWLTLQKEDKPSCSIYSLHKWPRYLRIYNRNVKDHKPYITQTDNSFLISRPMMKNEHSEREGCDLYPNLRMPLDDGSLGKGLF